MLSKDDIVPFLTIFIVWFLVVVIIASPFVFLAWAISRIFG